MTCYYNANTGRGMFSGKSSWTMRQLQALKEAGIEITIIYVCY